jgi:hypothetical protein
MREFINVYTIGAAACFVKSVPQDKLLFSSSLSSRRTAPPAALGPRASSLFAAVILSAIPDRIRWEGPAYRVSGPGRLNHRFMLPSTTPSAPISSGLLRASSLLHLLYNQKPIPRPLGQAVAVSAALRNRISLRVTLLYLSGKNRYNKGSPSAEVAELADA